MTTSDPSSPQQGDVLQLRAEDIVQALARRNPAVPRAALERAGRVVALISEAVVNDAGMIRRVADLPDSGVRTLAHEIASGLVEGPKGLSVGAARRVERARGAGLGAAIGREAGMARLAEHASAMSVEDWAGPLLASADVLAFPGMTPDALDDLRRSRAIIELPTGGGRTGYPSRQFSEGRPIAGLAEVQAVVGGPRTAWLWLVEPGDGGDPSWLSRLARGEVAGVLEAARQDFR